jgi:hypothetical protein
VGFGNIRVNYVGSGIFLVEEDKTINQTKRYNLFVNCSVLFIF